MVDLACPVIAGSVSSDWKIAHHSLIPLTGSLFFSLDSHDEPHLMPQLAIEKDIAVVLNVGTTLLDYASREWRWGLHVATG